MDQYYILTTLNTRINLKCHQIRRDIAVQLERSLQQRLHGKCIKEGYIRPGSVKLLEKSIGKARSAQFTGEITYNVKYLAEIFIPTVGGVVKARVRNNNKAGILAVSHPMEIIVARNSNLNGDPKLFDEYQIGDVINIKILQFELKPDKILAVGILQGLDVDTTKTYPLPLVELDLGLLQLNLQTSDTIPSIDTDKYGDPTPLYIKQAQIEPWNTLWTNAIQYFINPYELLSNSEYNKQSIIKFGHVWEDDTWQETGETSGIPYQPFSQSYYPMREMLEDFAIPDSPYWIQGPITVLNLAEDGGFIQAIIDRRGALKAAETDRYLAITPKNPEKENWDSNAAAKAYFEAMRDEGKNIETTYGADNTGDITHPENILWLQEQYPDGANLITANGAADSGESTEISNYKLIYSEILSALAIQERGGTFILKIFDTYTDVTAQLLQTIGAFYDQVFITKPYTSRPDNSEKYVVALGFKGWETQEFKDQFVENLLRGLAEWNKIDSGNVVQIMDSAVAPELQDALHENNDESIQLQMKKIDEGLNLVENINNPIVQTNIKTNQRPIAYQWCQRYIGEDSCTSGIEIDTVKI